MIYVPILMEFQRPAPNNIHRENPSVKYLYTSA